MGYAALRPSRRTDRSASEEWLSSRRKWVPTKIGERQSHGIQGTVVRFKAGVPLHIRGLVAMRAAQ
jgi:hypothetical protein